jgi:hypothetical protein
MKEPISDQCTKHETWTDEDGFVHLAFWWPQMGGYHGKAVARRQPLLEGSEDCGCVNVWVWHDGEFPFSGQDGNPAVLHICDFNDWLTTMEMLDRFQLGEEIETEEVIETTLDYLEE